MSNKTKMDTIELLNKCIKQLVIKCRQSKHSCRATNKTVKTVILKKIATKLLV